jgi:hypothetical protein
MQMIKAKIPRTRSKSVTAFSWSRSIAVMAFRNPGRRTRRRRGRIRAYSTIPANTAHIVQALLQSREPAAPKAALADIVIGAPWVVLLSDSGLFGVSDSREKSQQDE